MSRDYNRYQDRLALRKAKDIAKSHLYDASESALEKYAHKLKNNRKMCSCHMCRNPRHSSYNKGKVKLTLQERKRVDEGRGHSDVVPGME